MALGFIEVFLSPIEYKIQELLNTLKEHGFDIATQDDLIFALSDREINQFCSVEELELLLLKNKEIFLRFIKYSETGNLNFNLMVHIGENMIREDFTLDQFRYDKDMEELKNILLDRSKKQMEAGSFFGFIYDPQGYLEEENWGSFIKSDTTIELGDYEQFSLVFKRDKFNNISSTFKPFHEINYLSYLIKEWN